MSGGRPAPKQGQRHLVKQSGVVGGIAAFAVLAGLGLDVTIAGVFGAGKATDAFFVAARIPLGLVAVLMVAANQALVPSFSTSITRRGEEATWRTVSILVSALTVIGAALVLVAWALATPIVRVTAPGIPHEEVATAASMLPLMFAVVPLVAIAEVLRSVLNARYLFAAPAAMHIVMNGLAAVTIVAIRGNIRVVAVGYVVGSAAQAGFMLLMARRHDIDIRPNLRVNDPHVRATARLCVRPLVGATSNPVARLGEQLVLSFLPPGAITISNYGYRLISAIGGTVFFRSVVVALVPRLTEATARGEQRDVERLTRLGMRIMLAVSLPLTAFMAVLSQVGAVVIFQRGSFSKDSARLLGLTLAVYAVSLVGSAVQRALLAPFFSRLDTRTPLRNTLYGVAANLLLLPVLVLPLGLHNIDGVLMVALAYSLAQYVNVAHAQWSLRRLGLDAWAGTGVFAAKVAAASAVSAAVMLAAMSGLHVLSVDRQSRVHLLVDGIGVGIVGLVAFAAAAGLLTRDEVLRTWRQLRRRGPGGPGKRPATEVAEQATLAAEARDTEPPLPPELSAGMLEAAATEA